MLLAVFWWLPTRVGSCMLPMLQMPSIVNDATNNNVQIQTDIMDGPEADDVRGEACLLLCWLSGHNEGLESIMLQVSKQNFRGTSFQYVKPLTPFANESALLGDEAGLKQSNPEPCALKPRNYASRTNGG